MYVCHICMHVYMYDCIVGMYVCICILSNNLRGYDQRFKVALTKGLTHDNHHRGGQGQVDQGTVNCKREKDLRGT